MVRFKYWRVLLLTILTVFTCCEKDETEQADNLDQFGIFGEWGLQSITINGITDMSIRYDTLIFLADSESGDLIGEFRSSSAGSKTKGQFELDIANNIIHFDYNNIQKSYEFYISGNNLNFTYTQESLIIIEDWRKEE